MTEGVFFCYLEEDRKIFHFVLLNKKDFAKTFSLFPWRRYIRRKSHEVQMADKYCPLLLGKCGFEAESTNLDF